MADATAYAQRRYHRLRVINVSTPTQGGELGYESCSSRYHHFGVAIPRLATAQGLPDRIKILEQKVSDLENNRVKILEQEVRDLGSRLKELDEASGLVRTVRESYVITGGSLTPKSRGFGNRSLIAVVVTPTSAATPSHPPFVVLANSQVFYSDCVRFEIQGNTLRSTGGADNCPTNMFEVLYIYTGPRF